MGRAIPAAGLLAALTFGLFASEAAAQFALSAAQVDRIVSQAVEEIKARGVPNATIAVVDRVGNVLGVYRIGNDSTIVITSERDDIKFPNGLDKLSIGTNGAVNTIDGAALGAIAKAVTGAYLSSAGNAFTTRTASQIVQEFFNVGERGQPGGPLYGVQFSSLTCSDLVNKGAAVGVGPRRTPLGLSADPGGLPLYVKGVPVGGIGVIADARYSLDRDIRDYDRDIDEIAAIAGQNFYEPKMEIRAHRITVGGPSLRYSDNDNSQLRSKPKKAPAAPTGGAYITVPGYINVAAARAGTEFGQPASGYRPAQAGDEAGGTANAAQFAPIVAVGAFVLVDNANANRFPPQDGIDIDGNAGFTGAEVAVLLHRAFTIAKAGRAQIRKPLDSYIQVTISVVDAQGNILGIIRTPDAPVFGTDVSLQKARSATFFSRPDAGTRLAASPAAPILGLIPVANGAYYANKVKSFINGSSLNDGVAYGARSIGNIHRPFFPDGVDKQKMTGPLSTAYDVWSPFNVGLQLDLVFADIVAGLDGTIFPPPSGCVNGINGNSANDPNVVDGNNVPLLRNGLQIFAGGVPVYRGTTLIGGIGISGDGIDQDDMIAFLGTDKASFYTSGTIQNASPTFRANSINVKGTSLRYVACPFAPFIGSRKQEPCKGK